MIDDHHTDGSSLDQDLQALRAAVEDDVREADIERARSQWRAQLHGVPARAARSTRRRRRVRVALAASIAAAALIIAVSLGPISTSSKNGQPGAATDRSAWSIASLETASASEVLEGAATAAADQPGRWAYLATALVLQPEQREQRSSYGNIHISWSRDEQHIDLYGQEAGWTTEWWASDSTASRYLDLPLQGQRLPSSTHAGSSRALRSRSIRPVSDDPQPRVWDALGRPNTDLSKQLAALVDEFDQPLPRCGERGYPRCLRRAEVAAGMYVQAVHMLLLSSRSNPHTRAAVYRWLASEPEGVVLDRHARDVYGNPAVKIRMIVPDQSREPVLDLAFDPHTLKLLEVASFNDEGQVAGVQRVFAQQTQREPHVTGLPWATNVSCGTPEILCDPLDSRANEQSSETQLPPGATYHSADPQTQLVDPRRIPFFE